MKITSKQAYVLENLHRIEVDSGRRIARYLLDGHDCRIQLIGLGARGIVAWEDHVIPTRITDPDGIIGVRWSRIPSAEGTMMTPPNATASHSSCAGPVPGRMGRDPAKRGAGQADTPRDPAQRRAAARPT